MEFKIFTGPSAETTVKLDMGTVKAAQDAGAAHPLAYLETQVHVAAGQPSLRQQVYAQMCGGSDNHGTMGEWIQGKRYVGPSGAQAASTSDGSVTGRLVTQAYLMDAMEATLRANDDGMQGIFRSHAAAVDSINAVKFDRPLLDFKRPANSRPQPIAQLAEPARMLLLTTSQKSMPILGTSIGIEYSDQVSQNISIDIVALSIARQAEEDRADKVEFFLNAFLNGEPDFDMPALASVAGAVKTAVSLDPAATAGLTQAAWMTWLWQDSRKRKITTVITDLRGALEIENRKGRPTKNGDNPDSKRIDSLESVINPSWPDEVEVIVTTDPNWPANTIVGFDKRYGYHVVNSLMLDYSGYEAFAIRRSTKMRFDSGSIAYRLFDDAWSVLTYA